MACDTERRPERYKSVAYKAYQAKHYEKNKRRKAEYWARPENKSREAQNKRLRNYDITPVEYNFMLAGQEFRCALCGTDDPRHVNGWHTDHCHETNVVRGILCGVCNMGLGKLGDTPDALERAYLYTKGEFTWTQTQANQTNSPTPTDVTDGQSHRWPNTAQVESPYTPLFLVM